MSWRNSRLAMRSPDRFLALLGLATVGVIVWLGTSVYRSFEKTTAADDHALKTERLRGTITHLDEVLTMSARMTAATGEPRWEQRYRTFEPQLDAAIRQAMEIAESLGSPGMTTLTYQANQRLVTMEKQAFDFVREKNPDAARALLFSPEYEQEKARYSRGVTEFADALERAANTLSRSTRRSMMLRLALVSVVFVLLAATWAWVLRLLRRWQSDLVDSHARISRQSAVLDGINRVLQAALTCDTEQSLAITCLEVARDLTHSRGAMLGELDPEGRFIVLARLGAAGGPAPEGDLARSTPHPELEPAIQELWTQVAASGQPRRLPLPPRTQTPGPEGPTTSPREVLFGVPLKRRAETTGLIALVAFEQDDTTGLVLLC